MTTMIVKGQLVCVALNDNAQLAALEESFHQDPHKQPPTQPVLYFKPRNTLNVDGAVVDWPTGADNFVVGASLGVVIGAETCRVSEEDALNTVAGYTLVHDFSLPEKSYYRPDIKGKCLDGTAPAGPAVVSAAQLPEPDKLTVVTSVNGEPKRELPLANHHRSVASLISIISRIMTLQAGDVIAVGFPGERIAVQAGDKVVSSVDGLGQLTNTVGEA